MKRAQKRDLNWLNDKLSHVSNSISWKFSGENESQKKNQIIFQKAWDNKQIINVVSNWLLIELKPKHANFCKHPWPKKRREINCVRTCVQHAYIRLISIELNWVVSTSSYIMSLWAEQFQKEFSIYK